MDLKVHVDWALKEMKTLFGAGPEVMLIALWQIIWLLVQTQHFVRDKPQGWWTSLLETGDFKKINIWFVRWELLVVFVTFTVSVAKRREVQRLGNSDALVKEVEKDQPWQKEPRTLVCHLLSVTVTKHRDQKWLPEESVWVPEKTSIVAGEGWQQVTKSGSWESSALFTHTESRESELGVEGNYKFWKPALSDTLPLARLYLLKFSKHLQTISLTGDQVFK